MEKSKLVNRYILALGIIATISVIFFIFISQEISKSKRLANLINVAGKQRMLSQRTTLLKMANLIDYNINTSAEIQILLEEMSISQKDLGCKKLKDLCEYRKENLYHLDDMIKEQFNKHINTLATNDLSKVEKYAKGELLGLLELLDVRVRYLEKIANEFSRTQLSAEIFILVVILITLVLEVIFIFRPMINSIFTSYEQLKMQEQEISDHLKEKEQILDDLNHNLRTPLNHLYDKLESLKEKTEVDDIELGIEKIEESINLFLSFHKREENLIVEYTRFNNIIYQLPEKIRSDIEKVEDSIFVKCSKRNLKDLLSSFVIICKEYRFDFDIQFNGKLVLTIIGDREELSSFYALFQEEGVYPDIMHGTFLWQLRNLDFEEEFSETQLNIKIGFEGVLALKEEKVEIQKILIVEDNLLNQKILNRIVTNLGYQVQTASNGKEAVEMCEQESFDLVFMDLKMPIMNGYEAIIEIKKLPGRDPHFIVVSANNFLKDKKLAIEYGAHSFIGKPINKEVIKEEIDFAKSYYKAKKIFYENA